MKLFIILILFTACNSSSNLNPDCWKSQNDKCIEEERVKTNNINVGNLGYTGG